MFCGAAVPAIITEKKSYTVKSRPYSFADHRRDFIKNAGFWGALLILVGFFLPWIQQTNNISGFNFVTSEHNSKNLVLLVFPLCALFILIDSLTNFLPSGAAILFKVLPFLLLITLILLIAYKQKGVRNYGITLTDWPSALKLIGLGLWTTAVGSVIMLFHKKYRRV